MALFLKSAVVVDGVNPNCHLAKPAGDIVLGALVSRRVEHLGRPAELDEFAQVHKRGIVGDAGRLLQIVGHDDDRENLLEGLD